MAGVRSTVLLAVLGVFVAGCGEDSLQAAAETICAGIDAEASDEVAFEEYELSLTRERRDGMDEGELRAALDKRCGRAITVISAEAEPDAEPVEPPSVDPVDLQNVLWGDQDWTSTCVRSGESSSMSLTQGNDPGALWSEVGPDGEFSTAGMNYSVDTTSVVYGDITGDDLEEAIFATECFLGNDYEFYVEVWSHDEDGQPVQLPPVIEYTTWDGVIDSFKVLEGKLRINTSEPAPGEEPPHINGYPVVVATDWSFDGEVWLSEEISRNDTTPAPEPEPQPAPTPEPEPAPEPEPEPEPSACDALGYDGGDEDYCAEAVRSLEECYREFESDPDWYAVESGYQNVITGKFLTCEI